LSSSTTPSSSSLAPSSNSSENRLITCDGSQVYEITCKGTNKFAIQDDYECIDLDINWTNVGYSAPIIMRCEGHWEWLNRAPTSSISIKVGNSSVVKVEGSYTVINAVTLIPKIQVGKTEISNICVSYTSTGKVVTKVTCEVKSE